MSIAPQPETAKNCRQTRPEVASIARDLFTIPEFAQAVRISERQVYRLRAEGFGPRVIRLGGKILISRAETERWIRDCTEPACQELPYAYRG